MRILIFGAGAVGQAVGCFLAESGHAVDMVVRERFVGALRKQGVRVTGIFGDHSVPGQAVGASSSIDVFVDQPYDLAVVTAKSYDTATACCELGRLRTAPLAVMAMQNGCGNMEQVAACFGAERTLGARVITGFRIDAPGHVHITVTQDAVRVGGFVPGSVPAVASAFASALCGAGMPCETTADVHRDLYAKLLYNCALNPLGAILGVAYGALGDSAHTRAIMDAVIDEVFQVIVGLGGETHWTSADEYREFFYAEQLPATYHHRSSMIQDLEAGKRTEIEALTGYVSARGTELGIDTPVCSVLSGQIRFLERQAS